VNGASILARIRLFLLAVTCWLCLVPAAHAIRPQTPAELQLKEENPLSAPPAYCLVVAVDAEGRIGLFCVNDPLRYTDPTGKDFVINAGLVNGPVPYMTAKSTLGQIGASVYNMFPLVDNSIHQVSRGVGAVFNAAGDVAHDAILPIDPQLAENARNLPLLIPVGGVLGRVSKVEEAAATVEEAGALKYHYTSAPESSFKRGLDTQSSVTDNPNLTAKQAVEQLGVKTPPNKVIPIQDNGNFVPNKPAIVEEHPLGKGGGTDFYNPQRVPSEQIRPAIPIKPEK
jgi:hypothetical protein